VTIDFQQIKDFLLKKNKENEYRKMRDYNYRIIDPIKLCEMFIAHTPKEWSISFLESLPKNMKRCLADLFLGIFPFDVIKKKM